jgi:glycosyltransferase involved in cell wall biosynthesis
MDRQLTELAGGLLNGGHHVTVISRRCELPAHAALRWVRVPGPARPFPLAYIWFFVFGTWQVWRHRVGVLHTTGAIVFNRADVCTIHHCHYGARGKAELASRARSIARRLNRRLSATLARLAEKLIYRPSLVRRFVAVSEGVGREMRQHFPEIASSVMVIPNAVDHNVFRPDPLARREVRGAHSLSESDLVVLFVGGDWDWKGLHLAIQAVAALEACHLLVVGSGDVERYSNVARGLRCEDRIHFAGSRMDVARYYAAADVFLLPSAYETFSLVTYEAAASGLPLLVTRVSGVEEILTHGENGWFIDQDPDVIRCRLSDLRADPKMRATMGAKSRQAIAQYSWQHVVRDYAFLYRRLAEALSSPVPDRSPVAAGR